MSSDGQQAILERLQGINKQAKLRVNTKKPSQLYNPVRDVVIDSNPQEESIRDLKSYEPRDGEVRYGRDIGFNGLLKYRQFVWMACDKCHERRWVKMIKGQPIHKRHSRCPREDMDPDAKPAGRWMPVTDGEYILRKSKPRPKKVEVRSS